MSALSFFNQFAGLVFKYCAILFAVFGFPFIIYVKTFSKEGFRVNLRMFFSRAYLVNKLQMKETLIFNVFVNLFRTILIVFCVTLIMFMLSIFLK